MSLAAMLGKEAALLEKQAIGLSQARSIAGVGSKIAPMLAKHQQTAGNAASQITKALQQFMKGLPSAANVATKAAPAVANVAAKATPAVANVATKAAPAVANVATKAAPVATKAHRATGALSNVVGGLGKTLKGFGQVGLGAAKHPLTMLGSAAFGAPALNELAAKYKLPHVGGSNMWSPNLQKMRLSPEYYSTGELAENFFTRPIQSVMALSGKTKNPTIQDMFKPTGGSIGKIVQKADGSYSTDAAKVKLQLTEEAQRMMDRFKNNGNLLQQLGLTSPSKKIPNYLTNFKQGIRFGGNRQTASANVI